ncbi:hypothetical protein AB205_0157940 [Aquarana catesbeiana]|uniref:DUF4461 domain-containing protein n=1 Tax=Aquarana catesbeiana TaxID=8400 RepID=A0A2G9PQJ2_AQUCT|nr:hypothetical protein AB205_0157940 [Aquarana catesbeiana]
MELTNCWNLLVFLKTFLCSCYLFSLVCTLNIKVTCCIFFPAFINKLFESIPSYYLLQRKVLQLQERVSHLLGGIEIVHIEEMQPLLSLEEYCSALDAFCNKLLKRRVPIHPRSLRGLQMILEKLKFVEQELTKACTDRASLSRLYKEPSVSSKQMIDCCRRLIEEPLPSLDGMHLCVSHYYSILQDGDLCIPWNWKRKS